MSDDWEPLGPAGFYDTFGPEVSFGHVLNKKLPGNIAIAKFTHSGSQMNDWTPEGTMAESRHIYPHFITFVKSAIKDLEDKGHDVDLAGVFYHVGENDMSMPPYRAHAARWLQSTVAQSRQDLALPALDWYISQQPPTDDQQVNALDVTSDLEGIASADAHLTHIKAFDLPAQQEKLVLDTAGVVRLGELLAERYLTTQKQP